MRSNAGMANRQRDVSALSWNFGLAWLENKKETTKMMERNKGI
jgi:hypothetical protein